MNATTRVPLARPRRSALKHPLHAAVLAAFAWATATVALTASGLVFQVMHDGWEGPVAPANLAPAFALATTSYVLRILRWHWLARLVAPSVRFLPNMVLGAIGFGLIATPGRAGEILKLLLLREHANVPVATSTPILFLERLCEAVVLGLLAVTASAFLPWMGEDPRPKLAFVGLLVAGLVVVVALRRPIEQVVARVPPMQWLLRRQSVAQIWSSLLRGTDEVLSTRAVAGALGLTVAARLCDGLAIFLVGATYGVVLPLMAGWFLIGSSGFLGGISMSPGGAGVAEVTLMGLLLFLGASPAAATATTLTSRLFILWLWVGLGLALALRYALQPPAVNAESAA